MNQKPSISTSAASTSITTAAIALKPSHFTIIILMCLAVCGVCVGDGCHGGGGGGFGHGLAARKSGGGGGPSKSKGTKHDTSSPVQDIESWRGIRQIQNSWRGILRLNPSQIQISRGILTSVQAEKDTQKDISLSQDWPLWRSSLTQQHSPDNTHCSQIIGAHYTTTSNITQSTTITQQIKSFSQSTITTKSSQPIMARDSANNPASLRRKLPPPRQRQLSTDSTKRAAASLISS
jgi:hypothetical protein